MTIDAPLPDISYRHEIQRKLIHLGSLWIPALIYLTPRDFAGGFFVLCLIGMLSGEFLRTRDYAVSRFLKRIFMPILRADEAKPGFHLSGASYTVIAALLMTLLFPQSVAVTVLVIMLVADAVAALVGRKWGTVPLLCGKTVQGSLSFLVSALVCVGLLNGLPGQPHGYLLAGIAAACATTLTELFADKLRVDDNLSIPVLSGIVMWVVLYTA